MKKWQQMVIAWVMFLFYLLAGAFIFQAIELPHEVQAAEKFSASMERFLQNHPCLSEDELHDFSEEVIEAVDRGVFSLHDEYQTKNDKEEGAISFGERRTVWDLPNSFFFSATIVTTIGYGDLTPQSSLGRIICIIYGVIGLPLTGWVIGVIARSLTAYWTKALDKTDKILKICVRFVRFRKAFMILTTIVVLYVILLHIPATVLGQIEQWDILTAVYYCFITLTTIGFGDLVVGNHPDFSQAAKWTLKTCMVLYVMLGLSLLVALSSAIVERANKTVRKTLHSSNKYELSSQPQRRRGRERQKEALENVVALSHVPNLSSAWRSSPKTTEEMSKYTEEAIIELQSLSNPVEDVPPCYEEVIVVSETSDTSGCDKETESSLADLSVHRTSLANGNRIESNGHISVISMDEFAYLGFDSISTSSIT